MPVRNPKFQPESRLDDAGSEFSGEPLHRPKVVRDLANMLTEVVDREP